MSKVYVRVTLKDASPVSEDKSAPVQLDLAIDEETREVLGNWIVFGVWGSYTEDPNDLDPIVLHPDGRLDFGSGWEADRYGSCDIRSRKIKTAEYVNVTDSEGEEITYRISTVAVLGEKKI